MGPDFFIIGAPKCGTTSLSEYLGHHPEIFMCDPKEPHFFDDDYTGRLPIDWPQYLQYFQLARPCHRAIGEATPRYLRSEVAIPQILDFRPDARFIVMVRNPVDMAQAFHANQVFHGDEDVDDFAVAWNLQKNRELGLSLPRKCRDPKLLLYGETCLLGRQIERLYRSVDCDKVKIIVFEDFVGDTRHIYQEVLSFLGVGLDDRRHFPIFNSNRVVRSDLLRRGLNAIENAVGIFKRMARVNRRFGLSKAAHYFNTKVVARKEIDEKLKAELRAWFREDVEKLSCVLKRDLTHWTSAYR